MISKIQWGIGLLSVTMIVSWVVLVTGCSKAQSTDSVSKKPASAPVKSVDRMQDVAYTNTLIQARRKQESLAEEKAILMHNVESMKARARKVLSANATDEQVVAELDAHPDKYPGWQELKAGVVRQQKQFKEEKERVRNTIRARILQEAAEKKTTPIPNNK